jgi:hypothetical protein
VHIRSQPDVIAQIPAVVIRILIDHELIGVPKPVVAETNIIVRHGKIETSEPKSAGTASVDPPHMSPAESTGKMSVFPGMIEMIVSVVPAGVMADPLVSSRMNVRSFRVPFLICEGTMLLGCTAPAAPLRRRARMRGWPPCGNVSSPDSAGRAASTASVLLRGRGQCHQDECDEKSKEALHVHLLSVFAFGNQIGMG